MVWSIVLGVIVSLVLITIAQNSSKKNSREHPYWGAILDEADIFVSKKMFIPTETVIELSIDKENNTEPTEIQKEFYEVVENQYNILVEKMIPLLEKEVNNWKTDFKIRDFNAEFHLDWMTIPMNVKTDDWELGFTYLYDKNHVYIIYFRELEPIKVLIDG